MKIGRNEKCPCGSGLKYKRCCWVPPELRPQERTASFGSLSAEGQRIVIELQQRADEYRRKYGHVRPIIAIDHMGSKFVAVGNRLLYKKTWKTVHDFLIHYLQLVFGKEWWHAELQKPFTKRHPVLQWHHHLCEQFKLLPESPPGTIHSSNTTGPIAAYLALAYDLYILAHHTLLRERLIRRLKMSDQFQGARYETYVVASCVKAGFTVALEDETDSAVSHCEFTATHTQTGSSYSVEAKSRHRPGLLGQSGVAPPLDQVNADVYVLLQKALRKRAVHDRIVFIDVNVPPHEGRVFEAEWFKQVVEQVGRLERSQLISNPWPPAFVFFTNHPFHYVGADAPEPRRSTLCTAINMADFKQPDASIIVRKYPAIKELSDSLLNHTEIPHEFPQDDPSGAIARG